MQNAVKVPLVPNLVGAGQARKDGHFNAHLVCKPAYVSRVHYRGISMSKTKSETKSETVNELRKQLQAKFPNAHKTCPYCKLPGEDRFALHVYSCTRCGSTWIITPPRYGDKADER